MSETTENVFIEPTEQGNPEQVEAVDAGEAVEAAQVEPTAEEVAAKAQSKVDRRIASMTARNAALMAHVDKLERMIPKPDPNAAPAAGDYEARVTRDATAMVAKQAFDADSVRVRDAGVAEFGDEFGTALTSLWSTLGGFKPDLVEAAMETGNAHQILYKLGQDPDEAERIAGLSPARMGAALGKMAAATAPQRPQSQAPAPIRPLTKGGGNAEPRPDGDMDSFSAWYAKQREARRR